MFSVKLRRGAIATVPLERWVRCCFSLQGHSRFRSMHCIPSSRYQRWSIQSPPALAFLWSEIATTHEELCYRGLVWCNSEPPFHVFRPESCLPSHLGDARRRQATSDGKRTRIGRLHDTAKRAAQARGIQCCSWWVFVSRWHLDGWRPKGIHCACRETTT